MFDSLHEECGVFAVYSDRTADVAMTTYIGLTLYSTEDRNPAA